MPQDDSHIPALGKLAFNCPHPACRAYAHQIWCSLRALGIPDGYDLPTTLGLGTEQIRPGALSPFPATPGDRELMAWSLAECNKCGMASLWLGYDLIWPAQSAAPAPNPDLPPDAMRDYMEAASITHLSPRGAAALLRLAVQRLCQTLSDEDNLNHAIAKLVEHGLDPLIQQALDSVRVYRKRGRSSRPNGFGRQARDRNHIVRSGECHCRPDNLTEKRNRGHILSVARRKASGDKSERRQFPKKSAGRLDACATRY